MITWHTLTNNIQFSKCSSMLKNDSYQSIIRPTNQDFYLGDKTQHDEGSRH